MYYRNPRKLPRAIRATYRKTGRRQGPVSHHELTLTFVLPSTLSFAISPGPSGHHGVTVLAGGMVQVRNHSAAQCLRMAQDYLALIASQCSFAPIVAVIRRSELPTWHRTHELKIDDGVVSILGAPKRSMKLTKAA